ncbi:Hsp70 family protein [Pseudomaricurvus alcaniphilus]|uniref:Hsp70 family protein n=1 Tax=Pseudomaricurvus alcaniphilus TaxID=1166482 RepID=UPI001A9F219E|nr:Hsp70 family protein [Pseudomaricurvus alcaniphilus]
MSDIMTATEGSSPVEGPRYAIGIDLGTTNSVLSYVDLQQPDLLPGEAPAVHILPIPQLVAPGSVEDLPQLPSFQYIAHEAELNEGDLVLPWTNQPAAIVGTIARQLGQKTPMRLVASAKSWLCHGGVDRHAAFLPIGSPEEVSKTSPLQATYQYLCHLRDAWNQAQPEHPFASQAITVTIPASFDPVARELTAEAAGMAGIENLNLLEEPMAAVYSWVQSNGEEWRSQVAVGDVILVVDIGGGTTDLSLVAVAEEDGSLVLNRIAVGEHILLGGDNMDLALAYRVKAKLAAEGKELAGWQIQAITQACRDAKEALLSDNDTEAVPIVVPSRGSKLLGGTLRAELTRQEVSETLVEGFFASVAVDELPRQTRRSALTQRGLPYAQDPAVTRHLAAFLSRQQGANSDAGAEDFDPLAAADPLAGAAAHSFIKPTAILLNGGVLKAPRVVERLQAVINHWLTEADAAPAKLLSGIDLDLAVARGASYFGHVRQGKGVRIRGGLAHAYYVGIESSMPAVPGMEPPLEALCIAPFGMEEGTEAAPESGEFGLVVGEPVHFRFFSSSTRRQDAVGARLESWSDDELVELPEIQVTLPAEEPRAGEVVMVRLVARVTEVGTLALEAVAVDGGAEARTWKVELDVRNTGAASTAE